MPRKTISGVRISTPSSAARFNEAAARCRGKPPRRAGGSSSAGCFNEAAARCRGKLEFRDFLLPCLSRASMRPRPDAAENVRLSPMSGAGRP